MKNRIQNSDFANQQIESPITLIGVGNRFRGDDGAGWEIVKKLEAEILPDAQVMEALGEGASLIESMKGKERVLMFDAVYSGAKAGSIFRFEAHNQPIPAKFFNYSTHAFSLAEAIELARALNQLPEKLIVYGVEGKNFEAGTELSVEIKNAIPEVIKKVLNDIEEHCQLTKNEVTS